MTEETKKLIESVTVFTQHDVACSGGLCEWVPKSEFDRVVSELTRWNKVEDELPMSNSVLTVVLVKLQGRNLKCSLGISTATFDSRTGKFKTKDKFVDVTAWKYIN